MLLNIYDTKEVFVKELQVILAERLLLSKDYNVEREVVPLKYR
jgi:anaphase-promoting complex subunit 2